ncbi:blastula protease 10-like [Gigantopelta aegis]|uniref:blastula protease 10-like n=1 Tax=Gigantopelta aegis TaxID=1735272 RepID=UPI001B88DCB3|nr:blastula protease 10-like [Gigantopelta aegis]
MGQRIGLSFMDVKTANDLYQCSAHCSNSIKCNNGGVVGPDCTCLCPWGLSGYNCDDVKYSTADCGGVLRQQDGSISSPGYPNRYHDDTTCHWLILGPPGSTIKLWFNHFEMEEDYEGPCDYDWLEVRTLGPHLAGLKLCGSGPSTSLDYPGNALYLRFHCDESYSEYSGFEAGYSISGGYNDYDW